MATRGTEGLCLFKTLSPRSEFDTPIPNDTDPKRYRGLQLCHEPRLPIHRTFLKLNDSERRTGSGVENSGGVLPVDKSRRVPPLPERDSAPKNTRLTARCELVTHAWTVAETTGDAVDPVSKSIKG